MTGQSDPYVRVYYSVIDDERFETVYDDDARLALWLRLLLIADAMYPAPAPIPQGVKRMAFDHLVSVGLIETAKGGRFRVHGLAPERDRRRKRAANAANERWHGDSNALELPSHAISNAAASAANMLAEPSQAEPNLAKPNLGADGLKPIGEILRRAPDA